MFIVKISQPKSWPNKINISTPNSIGVWKNYKFILTDKPIRCNFWIVLGDVIDSEEAICPENNVIYVTDEAYDAKSYPQTFLEQFVTIITSRSDIVHSNVVKAPYMCGWFVKRDYDFLLKLAPNTKTKTLSAVCSDLTWLDGHKKRFAFINKIIGHFKDDIDVYGRGFNFIEDKFDALHNYQYSIAIENSRIPLYFTEKIADCFLTYTMPIYYGCPEITNYFPEESMILIDIEDYKSSIEQIEYSINNQTYKSNIESLVEARSIYLNNFHPLEALTKILDTYQAENANCKRVRLKKLNSFTETKVPIFKKLKDKLFIP